jgi:ABC-type transporter Mla MlaB component
MLKITRVAGTECDPVPTLELEGQLLAPWVAEVQRTCTELKNQANRIRLNLASVTFVDATGLKLLRNLKREGIEIAACSSYLAVLLNREDS